MAHSNEGHAGDGKVVLIVDDSAELLQAVKLLLEPAGFRVLQARDAFTGIRLAATYAPDAIVMDLNMPGMDGLEAAKYLRRIQRTRNIPIIAFTGDAPATAEQLANRGFDRLVPKSHGLEELQTEIEDVIHSHAA